MSRSQTLALVDELKQSDQDWEFYPTTDEIIEAIRRGFTADDGEQYGDYHYLRRCEDEGRTPKPLATADVLDCGAGDGRVLAALTDGHKYAIEKAQPLLAALPANVFVVGTDFTEQTLIDKKVDIVFCNPPYSEYEAWTAKIIMEANAPYVALVIPTRWKDSALIQQAIERRSADVSVVGEFNFSNADRQARAVVNVLIVSLGHQRGSMFVEAFDAWFDQHFELDISRGNKVERATKEKTEKKTTAQKAYELTPSAGDLVQALEALYVKELTELLSSYQKLSTIDGELLRQLGVSYSEICGALNSKISGLKNLYWNELFSNLTRVTDKLTNKTRKVMLERLQKHSGVDFTYSNVIAVVEWAVKNANQHYDDQLIEVFERLVSRSNVKQYKSNQKVWGDNLWRYGRVPEGLDRFSLELRLVIENCGGIYEGQWSFESKRGLTEYCVDFLNDLRTICSNLGYSIEDKNSVMDHEWRSNKSVTFLCDKDGVEQTLFECKAFKNSNVHIRFHPEVILRLNVEYGRLKGWIRSPQEAADEMQIDPKDAAGAFKTNTKLLPSNSLKMLSNG